MKSNCSLCATTTMALTYKKKKTQKKFKRLHTANMHHDDAPLLHFHFRWKRKVWFSKCVRSRRPPCACASNLYARWWPAASSSVHVYNRIFRCYVIFLCICVCVWYPHFKYVCTCGPCAAQHFTSSWIYSACARVYKKKSDEYFETIGFVSCAWWGRVRFFSQFQYRKKVHFIGWVVIGWYPNLGTQPQAYINIVFNISI